jgi:hypothetical protein
MLQVDGTTILNGITVINNTGSGNTNGSLRINSTGSAVYQDLIFSTAGTESGKFTGYPGALFSFWNTYHFSPKTSFAGAFQVESDGYNPIVKIPMLENIRDYLVFEGGITGSDTVTIKSMGADSNINILLSPKGSGKVGIGTATPNALLSLGSTDGEKQYVFEGGAVRAGFGVDLSGSSRELSIFHSTTGTNGNISFGERLDSTGAYTENMRITGGGNVGIGTTAPVDQLNLASGGIFRNGHGTERCRNFSLANNTDYTFTIAVMYYGTAEFHMGFFGQGAGCNVHVTLGGHMGAGAKYYSSTVLANTTTGSVTISFDENNANYVVNVIQTSGGTVYGSYWLKASTYTDGYITATATLASGNV